jgi:hypothetical protein
MFMISFRVQRVAAAVGGVVLAVVIIMGVANIVDLFKGGGAVAAELITGGATPVSDMKKVAAKTNEERLAFIKSFGWEVEEDPAEVLEVIIPAEFDDVYSRYNDIQKLQGCDLKGFAGERCKRYSYTVTNYPGVEGEVRFNSLVHKDKMIGGDVCSLEPNGFLHGFEAPTK